MVGRWIFCNLPAASQTASLCPDEDFVDDLWVRRVRRVPGRIPTPEKGITHARRHSLHSFLEILVETSDDGRANRDKRFSVAG